MQFPYIPVVYSVYHPGIDKVGTQWVPVPQVARIDEVLNTDYSERLIDAQMLTYLLYDPAGKPTPQQFRLTQQILPALAKDGFSVKSQVIVIDIDNIDEHALWTKDQIEKIIFILQDAKVWQNTHWIYSTPRGLRLVYVLSEPVSIQERDEIGYGMFNYLTQFGKIWKPEVSLWYKQFRVPKSYRSDKQPQRTHEHPFYFLQHYSIPLISPSSLPHARTETLLTRVGVAGIGPYPDKPTCQAMLYVPTSGAQTSWYRAARKKAMGKAFFDCIFLGSRLAPKGERNNTLTAFMGSACRLFSYLQEATPERIFALFYNALETLDEPEDPPGFWLQKGWEICAKYFQNHQLERLQRKTDVQTGLDSRASGMREWFKDMPNTPEESRHVVESHLMAVGINEVHLMEPSGRYEPSGISDNQLIPAINHGSLAKVINLTQISGQQLSKKTPREIKDTYGVPYHQKRYVTNGQSGTLIDGTLFLPLPIQSKEPPPPAYYPEVQEWLHQCFPVPGAYEEFLWWIVNAMDFPCGPICAAAIIGPRGMGKLMIAKALTSAMGLLTTASGKDLGRFSAGLMTSPLIIIHEGIPDEIENPSTFFRTLISGDPIHIERKYKEPVSVECHYRLLMTGNSTAILKKLMGTVDLTVEDTHAVAQRMLYFDCLGSRAPDYLRKKGGRDYTHDWIDYPPFRVPAHFRYLYEQRAMLFRHKRRGTRFIVEGDIDGSLFKELAIRSYRSAEVIETLIEMIQNPQGQSGIKYTEDGRIYVEARPVRERYNRSTRNAGRSALTDSIVRDILLKLSAGPASRNTSWIELSLDILITQAEMYGYDRTKLLELQQRRIM